MSADMFIVRHPTTSGSSLSSVQSGGVAAMSIARTSERLACEHCGGPRTRDGPGSFCSDDCARRFKGRNIINQIESQSRFCNTCYAPVRDVEPVPESVYPDADGFQYPTPNTTIGVDDFSEDRYRRLERTRWSCRCGAVNPDGQPIAELQAMHLDVVWANFWKAMRWLAERDAIAGYPNRERYFEALRERPYDAAYAAGKAVYG